MGGGCPSTRKEVLTPDLTEGVRTRPSKSAATTPTAYDVLYNPPVWPTAREKPWMWPTCARRNRRLCGGGQPRSIQAAGGSAGGGTKATQAEETGTRQLTAPQTADPM
jgi:hypothetical protein